MEAEPGGGDSLCGRPFARVEVGAGKITLDWCSSAPELSIGVEPGQEQSEVALLDSAPFGMELLERTRELIPMLASRPIGDRSAHPIVLADLLRQAFLGGGTAVLVLAAAPTRARCVPSNPCHAP